MEQQSSYEDLKSEDEYALAPALSEAQKKTYHCFGDTWQTMMELFDKLYLDKFHSDHIEVFRNDACIAVLNLDGTIYKNAEKAIGRDLLTK